MQEVLIAPASEIEKQWAAILMSESEPWTTLGIDLEKCIAACQQNDNRLFVAHIDQAPIGMIILQDQGVAGSPYIKSIAVLTAFRDKGVGKQLLQFAEEKYRANSRFIFLCVSSFNKKAQDFYRKNNYTLVGEFKDYIVEGFSELLMQKRLQ